MSATLLSDNEPLDPNDELLVAYVDGELDSKARRELEDQLLENESLRRRLQQLQQGWDLLDDFPSISPNEKLVESTLELVVADLTGVHETVTVKRTKRHRWSLTVAAATLVCIGIALSALYWVQSNRFRAELTDLSIAENLDAYFYGRDLQLMRDLALNEDWNKMILAMKEVSDNPQPQSLIAEVPIGDREEALRSMSLERRSQLDSRWKRFVRLSEQDQRRIRQTADEVANQSNTSVLLKTMQDYAWWRETIPGNVRDKIESDDLDERRTAIKQGIEHSQQLLSKRSRSALSDDTIERIDFALKTILEDRIESKDAAILGLIRRITPIAGEERAHQAAIAAMVIGLERGGPERGDGRKSDRGGGAPGKPRSPRPRFGPQLFDRTNPLTLDELSTIELILSNKDRETLNWIAGDPPNPLLEAETIRAWAAETVERRWRPDRETLSLIERYQSVDPARREMLDLSPPKEFLDQLTRP